MKTALLDTNAYGRLVHGEEAIVKLIAMMDITYLSVVVLGELYAGFYGGTKSSENLKQLRYVLDRSFIKTLDVTPVTAQLFAEVKVELRKKGKMIPVNDIWIAAQSIETGSELITYDTHFLTISKVRVWDELLPGPLRSS
ncbi:MAG: type II toxin-antitoxin system VapC family toxin [Treponema sp.]|jgi:tRNA(fMet)-specific endonuclease VapC|nr:type II toxin-antitoxin system VapC family toxin [Treponema sp.]